MQMTDRHPPRLRRALALVLGLCLVLSLLPVTASANDGLSGANIEDGVLIGYYGEAEDIVIPNTVTQIAGEAFKGKTLVSVTIPGSVSVIGYHAFNGCEKLERITFAAPEDGAEMTIRVDAFANCPNLTACEIPAVATYVTGNVFKGCTSLEKIQVHPKNPYYFTDDQGILFGP